MGEAFDDDYEEDYCPFCYAVYRGFLHGNKHADGCRIAVLPLRHVAGLNETDALLLLADRRSTTSDSEPGSTG
ncbi:hypothetical protein [Streptomyces sp. NPDC014676]|uniref:hypothetical protein n=1 Tax=Streptomyces sp. NPDC014676 TaxID=3364879 RepID=UPI0036FAB914